MAGVPPQYDLRDEKQVKEYLDNVDVEHKFGCYHERNPDACHRLGSFLHTVRRDVEKSRQVFTAACEDYGHGACCFNAAGFAYLGQGGPEDKEASRKMTMKSCEGNYPQGCHQVGVSLSSGEWTGKPDFVQATNYFGKGCDLGYERSCHTLVNYYIRGQDGVPKDMKKAFDLSFRLCEQNHFPSCVNVSQMYRRGEGVTQDPELAKKYRQRAVEISNQTKETQQTLKFGQ